LKTRTYTYTRTILPGTGRTSWIILAGLLLILLTACGAATPAPTALPATPTPTPTMVPSTSTMVPSTSTVTPATSTPVTTPAETIAPPSTDVTDVDEDGNTTVDQDALDSALETTAAGTLSDVEIQGILYMREEEKLARDVYLALYETWTMPIFKNISDSEATHMDAVKTLIDRYNLADPAQDKDVGVFVDATLQQLYDQLVAQGRQSLSSALHVGAAIEEIDILDLQEYIAQTDKPDIKLVYENLTKGSRNHLRSFISTLSKREGETYQPQYLDQDTYTAIVGSDMERGRGN